MKSDHRHDLKTNELAEWLNNLPQWAKENSITITVTAALVIGVAAFYIWRFYNTNILAQKQLELSNLIGQVIESKTQILRAQAEGKDISFILLQPADDLRVFAQDVDDDRMAAFALIKRAEALRTELHYRSGSVTTEEAATQINLAKDSYTEAFETCPNVPALAAMAKFGIGLCEEELGNFEAAEATYRDVCENPDFEGTVAAVQAKQRIETMSDYRQKVVFKPAPQRSPVETVMPADVTPPVDVDFDFEAPDFDVSLPRPDITSPEQDKSSDIPPQDIPNQENNLSDVNLLEE